MRSSFLSAAKSAILFTLLSSVGAVDLDVNDAGSIKQASAVLARSLLSYYTNNQPSTPADQIGIIQVPPLYWWESGAVWGGMVDYWAYTGDTSYVASTQQALMAQIGPDRNYMPPAFRYSLGNDDQAFWALSVLSALEYDFPTPSGQPSTVWFDLAKAVFDSQTPRWDTATCNGGLRWQIYSDLKGYEYKNTVSNGALFQLAARLARYTGEQTYQDWTNKIWDWMIEAKFISSDWLVFDGAQIVNGACPEVNVVTWTYNNALMMYGTAMMYNLTGSQTWKDRTTNLVNAASKLFFSPYDNSTNVLYEYACEPYQSCNYDQFSFKAYLARWMAKTAIVAPFVAGQVQPLLSRSAQAAAQACTGGASGTECGTKWYVSGFDGAKPGIPSVGQGLAALETIQSLLLLSGAASRVTPLTGNNILLAAGDAPSSSSSSSSSPAPPSSSTLRPSSTGQTSTTPRTTSSPSTTFTPVPTTSPSSSSTSSLPSSVPSSTLIVSALTSVILTSTLSSFFFSTTTSTTTTNKSKTKSNPTIVSSRTTPSDLPSFTVSRSTSSQGSTPTSTPRPTVTLQTTMTLVLPSSTRSTSTSSSTTDDTMTTTSTTPSSDSQTLLPLPTTSSPAHAGDGPWMRAQQGGRLALALFPGLALIFA